MSPQYLQIDTSHPDKSCIEAIAAKLSSGGVIVYPTDTIYGIGCDAFNVAAVEKVNFIKWRAAGQPLLVLIPGVDWVRRLVEEITPDVEQLINRFWPGPLTLILRASEFAPRRVMGNSSSIGIRWAKNAFLQPLLNKVGGPIVSTSANVTGCEPLLEPTREYQELLQQVDMVVDGGPLSGKESTVLDLSGDLPKLLREGAITRADLESVLGRFE